MIRANRAQLKLGGLLLVALALALAGCQTPAPPIVTQVTPAAGATAAAATATTGGGQAQPATATLAVPQATASQGGATAEPTIGAQPVYTATVAASEAVNAPAIAGGIAVTSTEDVTTPRTHFGGEYHAVATSDAVSFHPYLTTDTESLAYQSMVYTGGLLRLDQNTLDYIPNMAQAYSISPDGLTFTFKLRKNMLWSDGVPITANDFKWTYDQVTKPANAYPYLSQLAFISSYEALDDYTLQIKIKEVYAPALGQMAGLITPLPKHVWEKLDWSDPQKNPEIDHPSVVSGPYKLVEWKRDQYATFEANDKYWYHGAPNITRQTIEIVPSQDVAYQKFKSGEADSSDITPENLDEARHLPNATVYEWWPATPIWYFVGLNMRDGYLTHDINVRHGLSYAVDKQLMSDQIMLGQSKPLCSIYPDTSWAYNPNVNCYKYDTQQAIAEFAKSGYTFQNGKMLDKNGQQVKLKMIYGPNTDKTRELMAVTIQDFMSKIGVQVDLQALEWNSYLDAVHSAKPDWDMYLGAWQSPIEPHIMYTLWSQDNIPQLNSVAYVNKQVEDLFTQAGATYDRAVRTAKYQQIQQIITDDAPYITLFYRKAWDGENNRIKGITPSALGIGWNTEDWYIEAAK